MVTREGPNYCGLVLAVFPESTVYRTLKGAWSIQANTGGQLEFLSAEVSQRDAWKAAASHPKVLAGLKALRVISEAASGTTFTEPNQPPLIGPDYEPPNGFS